eukprot:5767224-Pleurochrysis_carterae.AAC.4
MPHRRHAREREPASQPVQAVRCQSDPLRQRRVDRVLERIGLLPRARERRKAPRAPELGARPVAPITETVSRE